MSISKIVVFICILISTITIVSAAFSEETIEGTATNISENHFYLNGDKISLPAYVIANIKEDDSISYGYPEPLLIVYEDNKLKYGYGDIFHFTDSVDLVNGVKIELQKTKRSFGISSEMADVTTYFRVTKDENMMDFSLDPGEYTTVWGTVIAVHRAEEPNAPAKGPQHWYVYEIYSDKIIFSNNLNINYVKPDSKDHFAIALFSVIMVLIIFIYFKRRKCA